MIDQLLIFKPILKEKIWGGTKLIKLFGKNSTSLDIGESWEISDVKGDESRVSKGFLKNKTLKELIELYKTTFLGSKVYNQYRNQFPLLIKFIDAKEKLSIQLHPDENLAKKRHDSLGKTEMWYIMQADENATITVGFRENSNEIEYLKHLNNKTLLNILNVDAVAKGDVYFIPTGRIHGIGAGVLLAEIQQTSDNTYRIYDWDRKDKKGKSRTLHTDLAKEAIDYKAQKNYKTTYSSVKNEVSEIITCPYFTTNVVPIEEKIELNHSKKDSFIVYMCIEGKVKFKYKDQEEVIKMGETLLAPACVKEISITPVFKSKLLEVYIK